MKIKIKTHTQIIHKWPTAYPPFCWITTRQVITPPCFVSLQYQCVLPLYPRCRGDPGQRDVWVLHLTAEWNLRGQFYSGNTQTLRSLSLIPEILNLRGQIFSNNKSLPESLNSTGQLYSGRTPFSTSFKVIRRFRLSEIMYNSK